VGQQAQQGVGREGLVGIGEQDVVRLVVFRPAPQPGAGLGEDRRRHALHRDVDIRRLAGRMHGQAGEADPEIRFHLPVDRDGDDDPRQG
jgi:hypothetical protein